MVFRVKMFLDVFRLELSDLESDIELLIKQYTKDHDEDKISNYVFYQNVALMQNELFGVQGIDKEIAELDAEQFDSVDNVIDWINQAVSRRCKEKGSAKSMCTLIGRKLEKVKNYVTHVEKKK